MGLNLEVEKVVYTYFDEYKKGILGKKYSMSLLIYPSTVEGHGFKVEHNEWGALINYTIPYKDIVSIEKNEYSTTKYIKITYKYIILGGMRTTSVIIIFSDNIQEKYDSLMKVYNQFLEDEEKKKLLQAKREAEERLIDEMKEQEALDFYLNCYNFHINPNTPIYKFIEEKNRILLIYIDSNKSINFLKLDGYAKEEYNATIDYSNIHYFEKAGNIHYVTDIQGNYSSFGGSFTDSSYSKFAVVGGGLLFGIMGMALGKVLTHKPAEFQPSCASFEIESDVTKIDDRSVILNFYSDLRKQYVDLELPQDTYNFLQTYLPEKKYSIVDELEKKAAVHQSTNLIENGSIIRVEKNSEAGEFANDYNDSVEDFAKKIKKLKMLKNSGILSDEEFEIEKKKLLMSI